MNDMTQTLLRSVLKIGAGMLVAKGLTDQSGAETLIAGIIGIAGVVWGMLHRSNGKDGNGMASKVGVLILIAGLAGVVGLTGCMMEQKGNLDIQAIDQRVLGFNIKDPTQGIQFQFGYISTRSQRIPVRTNVLYSPNYMQNFGFKKDSLWRSDINDNSGSGNVYVGGKEDVSKAIVPSVYVPGEGKVSRVLTNAATK